MFNNNDNTTNNNNTGLGGNTHDNDGRLGAGTKGMSPLRCHTISLALPPPCDSFLTERTTLTLPAARALQPDFTKDQSQIHREKAEGKIDE